MTTNVERSDKLVGVLLNFNCTRDLSKSGRMLIEIIKKQIDPSFTFEKFWDTTDVRHDKTIVNLCIELGSELSNNKNYPIVVQDIPEKYLNHYHISGGKNDEYIEDQDYFETLYIDHSSYIVATTCHILGKPVSNEEKLNDIAELLLEPKYNF
jgi:hypothetical protein